MQGKEVHIFALWRSLIKCVICGIFWPYEMGWFLFDRTIVVWASGKCWWENWWHSWPGVSARHCPFCLFFPLSCEGAVRPRPFCGQSVCPPLCASGCALILLVCGGTAQILADPHRPETACFPGYRLLLAVLWLSSPSPALRRQCYALIIFVSPLCPSQCLVHCVQTGLPTWIYDQRLELFLFLFFI